MKKTVLFIYSNYSTFVEKDESILSNKFDVIAYQFDPTKKIHKMIFELIKQFIFVLVNIRKVDFVYSWFSDFHSLIPFVFAKILNKKTFVIVGGFDAVSIPELNYGLFHRKNIRRFFGIKTFLLSDYILPVDESLIQSTNFYYSKEGVKVGIKHFIPNINGIIKVIPTDYDYTSFNNSDIKRENSVIAIAFAQNKQKFIGKGNDFLIEVAKKMPETTFNIYGLNNEMISYASEISPNNVNLFGPIDKENVNNELSKNKVYVLFSMSEGLPNSLCEAMLCGCIPVGSNVGGIKSVIGQCGFVLMHKDVDKGVSLVKQALSADKSLSDCSRKRIIDMYPIGLRESELFKIIK